MTPENFTFWLQGFMEIQNPTTLDKDQIQIIKDHLDLVFNKVTPVRVPIAAPTIPIPISPPAPTTYPGIFPKTQPYSPITNPTPSNPWEQSPTIYCSTGDSPPLCSVEDFGSMIKGPAVDPAEEMFKKGPSKRIKIAGEIGERIPSVGRGGSKLIC